MYRVHPVHSASYGGPVGSPATIVCKPRQGRKAATVVNDSGAGMRLTGLPPFVSAVIHDCEDHAATVHGRTLQQVESIVLSGCSQPDSPSA